MTREPVAEAPIRVGACWLVPVSVTTAQRSAGQLGRWGYWTKTPEAVVMVEPERARAFAMDGSERDPARLYDEVPGLRAVVSSLRRGPAAP